MDGTVTTVTSEPENKSKYLRTLSNPCQMQSDPAQSSSVINKCSPPRKYEHQSSYASAESDPMKKVIGGCSCFGATSEPSIGSLRLPNQGNTDTMMPQPCGLKNFGNTCYINSALQCLNSVQPLIQHFYNFEYTKDHQRVANAYGNLVRSMWSKTKKTTEARDLKSCVAQKAQKFVGSAQRDAFDFMLTLMNALHEEIAVGENSILMKLFDVRLESRITCIKCGINDSEIESMLFLSLPLPSPAAAREHPRIHVNNALQSFQHEYKVDGPYRCAVCPMLTEALQKTSIYNPTPEFIIVQLKRFPFNDTNEKVHIRVEYPLTDFCLDGNDVSETRHQLYDLSAVLVHSGTLSFGHYITYARHNNNWFKYNDEWVTPISDRSMLDFDDAYILVYEKQKHEFKTYDSK